jgi:excisionase family DNA binding protein
MPPLALLGHELREGECATLSVPEAGKMLGLSRNAAYSAAARGDIPTLKLGPRTLRVSKVAIARLLEMGKSGS